MFKPDQLATCNAIARFGLGTWCPVRMNDGSCFSPDGYRLGPPDIIRSIPADQITAELDRLNKKPDADHDRF